MNTVLVVEDDPTLARALMVNLRARGYEATHVTTGKQALQVCADHAINVVLLDLGLPDISGMEVIDGIRGWSQIPIIVITARHEVEAKIEALDRGADDFVTKPFALGEVLARMRAALRRAQPGADTAVESQPQVETGDGRLRIDLATTQVWVNGEVVRLTPTEWSVLETLVKHRGALVRQRDLLSSVWGPKYQKETNYLRVYISQLRNKLEADPSRPMHLITELGMGYRFVP